MTDQIQQMTVDEFSESRIAVGDRVEKFGSVYWVRTSGFFFRPLLPHEVCPVSESHLPQTRFGGFQCVVSDASKANSVMKFVMLDEVQDYDLGKLRHSRRFSIKTAARRFSIRPIDDMDQFKEQGFRAYSSFYERTRYGYKRDRIRRKNYDHWVESVLGFPKILILGGYDEHNEIRAVSLSYWVRDTLSYTTFFADTMALQRRVGELMFHRMREMAGQTPGIREIFLRMYQGGNGMDNYYCLRGARVVAKPCKLHLDPVSRWILKSCFPARYAMLAENTGRANPWPRPLDDPS